MSELAVGDSFYMQITIAGATPGGFFGLIAKSNTGIGEEIYLGRDSSNWVIGQNLIGFRELAKGGQVSSDATTLVVKATNAADGQDTFKFWINPDFSDFETNSLPTGTGTLAQGELQTILGFKMIGIAGVASNVFVHQSGSSPFLNPTFGIAGNGADNSMFEVVRGNQLRFKVVPDFENPTDSNSNNVYQVSVRASDGQLTTDQTILVTVTDADEIAPTVDIVDVTPDPRNTSVGVVTIDFDEGVTGADVSDLALTRDGVAVDISSLTLNQISPRQYTIDMTSVTAADGNYELKLSNAGSGIQDAAGNALATDAIDQFMIDMVGPQIESVVVNGGNAQRSMVSELTVAFSEIVGGVDANSFVLLNTTTNMQIVPTVTAQVIGGKTVATLTFSGAGINGGSLADGDYTLTTLDTLTDNAGNQLDGDKDGNAGGNATDQFFRFFGDVNGDRSVNIVDFFQFRNAFRGNYNAAFDYNGDGAINIIDFFQFRSRFGSSL